MQYLLHLLTIIFVSQRVVIKNNILRILGKSHPIKTIEDKKLTKLVKNRTGLKLSSIKLINDQKPHAAMIGIPGKPIMVMSSGLYNDFTVLEKEYVALHEAGHYQLKHSIKIFLVIFLLFIFGSAILYVLNSNSNPLFAILFGLLLGIGSLQYQKKTEIEADQYAATKISNPIGMISATKKFEKAWGNNSKLFSFLFNARVAYAKRIQIAKEYGK